MRKAILAVLALIVAAFGGAELTKLGAAPTGANASLATSSLVYLGATNHVIFATSTNCVSRIITGPSDADIWFETEDEVPIAGSSHKHASTTEDAIVYDAGIWGCGAWRAISADSVTARVTEFTDFR